jgi:hypothetical protein
MATFLAIPPTTVSGLATLPSAAVQRLTESSRTAVSPTVVADSTSVTLSAAAQVLAAIGGNTAVGNATPGSTLNDGLATPTASSTAAVASERSAFSDTLVLQNLLDDPGLRAIKNQADPLYSALIAASHLIDFVPAAAAGVNLNAIVAELPVPVSPAAAARAIDFYRETAEDTRTRFTA